MVTDVLFQNELLYSNLSFLISITFLGEIMSAAQLFSRIGQFGLGVALVGGVVNSALYNGDHERFFFCMYKQIGLQLMVVTAL